MLKSSRFVRVLALTGTVIVLACTKAPFSIPENNQSPLRISPAGSTIQQGNILQLRVFVDEAADRGLDAGEVTWNSSAPGTAVVNDSGLVVGVSAGQATITAQFGGYTAISIIGVVDGGEGPTCAASEQVPNHCPILSR
jgi:hypothetical protein